MRPTHSAPNRGSRPVEDLAGGRISKSSVEEEPPGPKPEEEPQDTRRGTGRSGLEEGEIAMWKSAFDAAQPLAAWLRFVRSVQEGK